MRQFAVILFFMAAASSASASPQNLGDRIREGIMKAKEGLEGAGTNCIKIGLPGKLILSKRKGLWEVLIS